MAENKTKPTSLSVESYLASISDESRRADCGALVALLKRLTKCDPVMWGSSIVGFGSYHYRYASGREGDYCVVGFSSRKTDLTLYLMGGFDGQDELLQQLGPHKIGKACLYLKRLSDVKRPVLEKLIKQSIATIKKQYPAKGQTKSEE